MPELSYPINPPTPNPPTPDPNPPNPSAGNPPSSNDTDICTLLQQANENTIVQCDSVHFGTPKCELDWIYAHTAPCGFSNGANYRNGIGYAGTFFQSFDQKGFFRIEGVMDADAGEPNLYSYAGSNPAFEVYMYRDGLNIKGLQGASEGSSETCHIKVFKSAQQTEIDYQGVTNLSSEGAQIFKSQLYKQTIEAFVRKYSYGEEWVGLEANVSKSITWGGLDLSNYYRLMYDNAGETRGFLEILHNGYSDYHQIMVKNTMINHYSQFASSTYYKNFVIDGTHGEDELYFGGVVVKALTDQNEASTYNSFYQNDYATLVSKSTESYVYLTWGGDYSFLESKNGDARLWGSANGGNNFFDIKTQGSVSLQLNQAQDYMYVAPEDIPTKSEPEKHYAAFDYFWYIDEFGAPIKEAIISSGPIDIRHLGTCWAKYPCKPVLIGPPCLADLTFGGLSNQYCRLSAFDVYVGSGPEFELYQYNYGMDLKPANNQSIRAAFYTDGASTMNLDVNGTTSAYVNAKNAQGNLQAYAHFNSNYNGFALINNFNECYMTTDGSYRYLILDNGAAANWRTVAGNTSADTTIYTAGGSKQVAIGAASSQAYMQFYSNNGSNQMFGFASNTVVQWEGTIFGAYAQMKVNSAEGKFQTSKGSQYAQMFSDLTACDLSLVSASRSTINASAGSANWSVSLSNGEANAYWQGGNGQVSINTDDCKNKYVSLREIDVCIDGEKKKMIILASEPY